MHPWSCRGVYFFIKNTPKHIFHYSLRRNGYDEVIFSIRSSDRPPNESEGAIHIYKEELL